MWELERASNATGILFVYFPIKKQISFKEYLYITNSKLSSVIAKLKVSAHLLFLGGGLKEKRGILEYAPVIATISKMFITL